MTPKKIKLVCPACKRSMIANREPDDPTNAVEMHDWCPECGSGGFSDPSYYDADGKQIMEE